MKFRIALSIAIVYLILGNIVGIQFEEYPGSDFIESIFAPYSFIAGQSSFAGWDSLSLILELVVFALSIPFFLLLVNLVIRIRAKLKKR